MSDKFLVGMLLGVVGGAVLVTNSVKARKLVKDGQEQVLDRVDKMAKSAKKENQE